MDLRLHTVNKDNILERVPLEPPCPAWLTDGRVRWFDIEAAADPLVDKLLAPLGVGPAVLRRYNDPSMHTAFVERGSLVVFSHPFPSVWYEQRAVVHFICMKTLLVTFHSAEARDFEKWCDQWICDWPLASPTIAAVVQRLMESLAEEDKAAYYELRNQTSDLANMLKQDDATFEVGLIEEALTAVHRINSFFFDQRLIYAGLQGVRTKAFSLGEESGRFQIAATAAEDIREGSRQLHRRIENLHQQHMLDLQALTDRNLRLLTVVSAVFLPLTLISGIYGMNFVHMPELDEHNAYPIVLGSMGLIAIAMFGFFHWRGWLK